jgi:hypothetical protein
MHFSGACIANMSEFEFSVHTPVPSPVGLVVKNGLNIFSFTSAVIPVPLSWILISTRSPRSLVEAVIIAFDHLDDQSSLWIDPPHR